VVILVLNRPGAAPQGVGDQRGHIRRLRLLGTVAKHAAESPGRHDLHHAGLQAAVGDPGAVHAHHRPHRHPQRGADRLGLKAQGAKLLVHRVVVVPHPAVGGLRHAAGVALAVDQQHPGRPITT